MLAAALREAAPLRRRRQVLGLSIGMRRADAAWVRGEDCIAIRVVRKLAPDQLRSGQALPSYISVRHAGRTWRVPTDVRCSDGATAGRCYRHVAQPLRLRDDPEVIGAVSACVITTSQPKVLISGHVALKAGRRLIANGLELVTEEPRMGPRLDHCLATADYALADAVLPNGLRFAGLRDRASLERGDKLFVFRALEPGICEVEVRDTDADALFKYPAGLARVYGLIQVDDVCRGGDSGSPLFDADFRLVGTLLGGLGQDYYLPADYAFEQLQIALPPGV